MLAPTDTNTLTEDTARAANQMLAKLAKLGIIPADEPEVTPSESLESTLIVFRSGVVNVALNTWTREARFTCGDGEPLRLTLVPFGDMAPEDADIILTFFGKAEKAATEAAQKASESPHS